MRCVVIDTLGSDKGEAAVINGVADAIEKIPSFKAILVGDEVKCNRIMSERGISQNRYSTVHTTDFISNSEPPVAIYGGRDTSSMAMAFETAKKLDECVGMLSAGNTGALLVGSMCRLGLCPSVRQPALASALPFLNDRYVCIADCGANIDCKPKELLGFAKMGNALMKSMYGIKTPRIGLLSVGREDSKGNTQTKEAFALLKESTLDFVGNVEGSDIVSGVCDVIVCDGFAGNILLKSLEAVGKYASHTAAVFSERETESERLRAERLKAEMTEHFDFNARGGAIFLGTSKTLVKMHGAAEERTVVSCIELILTLDDGDFSGKLREALAK